jgi:hypothetical protein
MNYENQKFDIKYSPHTPHTPLFTVISYQLPIVRLVTGHWSLIKTPHTPHTSHTLQLLIKSEFVCGMWRDNR